MEVVAVVAEAAAAVEEAADLAVGADTSETLPRVAAVGLAAAEAAAAGESLEEVERLGVRTDATAQQCVHHVQPAPGPNSPELKRTP